MSENENNQPKLQSDSLDASLAAEPPAAVLHKGPRRPSTWKERLYEIIFEADTKAGKRFDVALLIAIVLSVLVVMCESVQSIHDQHGRLLVIAEWVFTALFTAEYFVRLLCSRRPIRYMFSFYGIVDLLALLPTYLTLVPAFGGGPNAQRLTVIRALRLLRAFRIFKLAHMLSEANAFRDAIWAARAKIAVFLTVVMISVVIAGSAMHLIEGGNVHDSQVATDVEGGGLSGGGLGGEGLGGEGQGGEGQGGGDRGLFEPAVNTDDSAAPETGFDSIPQSMYWAIVTMTTVGYGDTSPVTPLGKAVAAIMMLLGYCLIIVPTSLVSAELVKDDSKKITTQVCPECHREGHDKDAAYCKFCGSRI